MNENRNSADAFVARLLSLDFELDRSNPLSVQVYQLLRQAIVTMTLQPDDVIFDRTLAEALDVSRTPVREALLQLSREELVRIAAQSGTFVAPVMREQVAESALIREALETASIRRAAEIITPAELDQLNDIQAAHRRAIERENAIAAIRCDNDFHAAVCAAARLKRVQHLVELARAPIDRVRHVTVRDPVVRNETLEQHQLVLEALSRHDPDGAERALRNHLADAFAHQQVTYDENVALFQGR
ncbi:MAG TPA: GntR family transcriptional regulator [Pararobbsia sp.]|nr:GntR family transcriptional regulator [Pararobbsia sp.]